MIAETEVWQGDLWLTIERYENYGSGGAFEQLSYCADCFRPLVNDADDAEIEAQIYRKKHHRATRRVGEDA